MSDRTRIQWTAIAAAVSKAHHCFIGGRHDLAMVQLREWLAT